MPLETKDEPGLRMVYEGALATGINVFILVALFLIFITIWRITAKNATQTEKYVLLGAWGILPPVWFLVEYFFIFLPYGIKGSFAFFQYGQGVAAKVWAAVFALISVSLYSTKAK